MTPADNKAHVWSSHCSAMCPHLCVNRKLTHAAGMYQEVSSLSLLFSADTLLSSAPAPVTSASSVVSNIQLTTTPPLGLIVLPLNMNTATILFIVNACVIRNSLIIIYILYSVRMLLVCKILDLPTINPIFVRDYKIPNLVPEGSPPLERVFSINYCDNGLVNCLFAYQPWTRSLWDQSVSRS